MKAAYNPNSSVIDPDDAAMLFIDHQSGLFHMDKDIDTIALRANAATLAKVLGSLRATSLWLFDCILSS